ncbi:hypothetical protein EIN_055170 [Entamoeba invadens IP1]|uniref:hypothetical protein n=1 Tax=Entamoeba invadens IP1 TaxID=370355 RepID=UPI0002C3EF60|nr:hypothetical protein EIN_055170 [Entamoeba invadens IP1]ELP93212.1 hypothetical protein EIN_055170 [Entamoeba invadens IP1]|eukprot:XP_004259983.1 hypothetical protein EIN_055170 [Entamoeba invadens IP1]
MDPLQPCAPQYLRCSLSTPLFSQTSQTQRQSPLQRYYDAPSMVPQSSQYTQSSQFSTVQIPYSFQVVRPVFQSSFSQVTCAPLTSSCEQQDLKTQQQYPLSTFGEQGGRHSMTFLQPPLLRNRMSPINFTVQTKLDPITSSFKNTEERTRAFSTQTIHRQHLDLDNLSFKSEKTTLKSKYSMSEDLDIEKVTSKVDKKLMSASHSPIRKADIYTGLTEFDTLEEAIGYLTDWATSQGLIIRKGSANNKTNKDGTRKKQVLVCQCSGKYRSTSCNPKDTSGSSFEEPHQERKKRKSKKTECPFRINLNFKAKLGKWKITKMVLQHNHL